MNKQNSTLSFIGIGIGAIALLLALIHFWAGPFAPQPALEQTVAEKAVAIKEATVAALKGEELSIPKSKPQMDMDKILDIVTAAIGGLAIILGVVGYAKKEPMRISGGAVFLGAGAIAFQFLTFALGAIILVILIAAVLGSLGLS